MSKQPVEPELAACVGLDWADQQHLICLQATQSSQVESKRLDQKPDALHEWIAQLRVRFAGARIGIAIEQSRGAVIHALMMYEFLLIYPINPKALARYREAFRVSGAKDDPSDAELLMDLLRLHRNRLRSWLPDSVETRRLQILTEYRRKLVNTRIRHTNRITSLLKMYFPQALDWAGALDTVQACDFLQSWPTLTAVQQIHPAQVRAFYHQHRCRNRILIEQRLAEIYGSRSLTDDPAIIETLSLAVQAHAAELRTILEWIAHFDKIIAQYCALHPEHDLFESFPGAGAVYAPRLLTVFGQDRARWISTADFLCHSGIAPVTKKSGNSRSVHRRLACSNFIRQTFHEFAAQSIRYSSWARAYYDQMRARGLKHPAAVRALAFKWIRIMYRCWKDRKPYDEQIYLASLRAKQSPLIKDPPAD
ncbi:MAG TPA: IS110 family transposase [Nitrospiraceae bacterium]|nr:IS110 family transposase [Nitrospiraceae bacterium]